MHFVRLCAIAAASLWAAMAHAAEPPLLRAQVWQDDDPTRQAAGLRAVGDLGDYGWLRVDYGRTRVLSSGFVEHAGAIEWRSNFDRGQRWIVRVSRGQEVAGTGPAVTLSWVLRY